MGIEKGKGDGSVRWEAMVLNLLKMVKTQHWCPKVDAEGRRGEGSKALTVPGDGARGP